MFRPDTHCGDLVLSGTLAESVDSGSGVIIGKIGEIEQQDRRPRTVGI
jgi:hypothetical protein